MVTIIDYDAGNLKSVEKAFDYLGVEAQISRDKNKLLKSDKVILPGVGNFGDCMEKLNKYDLIDTIKEIVDKNIPFMGICLGLQLLFDSSEEACGVKGLGLLKGTIKKFPDELSTQDLKIPQIGWNSLNLINDGRIFKGMDANPYVYFVHSYYLEAEDESIVKASCNYGIDFHASVEKNNIFACQFHPEKSGDVGLKILKNFSEV